MPQLRAEQTIINVPAPSLKNHLPSSFFLFFVSQTGARAGAGAAGDAAAGGAGGGARPFFVFSAFSLFSLCLFLAVLLRCCCGRSGPRRALFDHFLIAIGETRLSKTLNKPQDKDPRKNGNNVTCLSLFFFCIAAQARAAAANNEMIEVTKRFARLDAFFFVFSSPRFPRFPPVFIC